MILSVLVPCEVLTIFPHQSKIDTSAVIPGECVALDLDYIPHNTVFAINAFLSHDIFDFLSAANHQGQGRRP